MIDTADIHARLHNEYASSLFEESWWGFEHFLMVKIMRLERDIVDLEGEVADLFDEVKEAY